jgi:signal transduction histidine kinase
MAAGVRHELMTRALPALRHDLAGPVSVVRMGLILLKKKMSDPANADAAAWAERVSQIEDQIAALAGGVRSLRDWELATNEEDITRSALVKQCAALMRVAFEFNGIELRVDEALEPAEAEPRFPSSASLRYMVLGALAYLHDSVPQIGVIRVEAQGADALAFAGMRGIAEPVEPFAGAHRAPRALAIDAIALQSLADGLGFAVEVGPDTVRFSLAPA